MATTSFAAWRRFAGLATSLLLGLGLAGAAAGQGSAPLVTASSPSGLDHPTGWKNIQQTALDANGDWLVEEFPDGGLFEFPADGSPMITLVPLAGLGSTNGYQNPALAIDPGNNLYVGGNWNNCLLKYPYDAATKTWPGLSDLSASNNSAAICPGDGSGTSPYIFAQYGIMGFSPYYFQPWGIAIGNNNNLIVGSQNSGNFIMNFSLSGGWSNPTVGSTSMIISAMSKRPISVAQDPEGNVYVVEDSSGLAGVYEIPASVVAGGTAAALASDDGLTRVDPNLPNVTGVITDPSGNLYISDGTKGVFMVPNASGTPDTANAVMLSPLPAQGEVALDLARHILYVPTTQKQNNGLADVARVGLGTAEFGAAVVGKATTIPNWVDFSFNGDVTPDRAVVVEGGAPASDFTITGGTCAMGTAYAANSNCRITVTMTPHAVGEVSGKLLLQKSDPVASGAADASDSVTAFSTSGNVMTLTANNTLFAGEEIQFSVADSADALYALNGQSFTVLPAGLSATQFSISATVATQSGSTSAIVTAKAFTTVASIVLHGVGQGANIQASPALEGNIGSLLSTPSQIAVDGQGNMYVADPGLGKVVMYPAGSDASSSALNVGSGLTSPTGVAVDGAGDVFIADSGAGSVYEIPFMPSGLNNGGGQTTLMSGLGTTGLSLAADGLGNLYVADPSNKRVVKISNAGATGAAGGQTETMLTSGFTAPSAVAVDSNNNLYVIDGVNLFELAGGLGAPTTLLNNLSGATGLAIDASGAVYISSGSGTERIPLVSGALSPANATAVASTVSGTSSVALDHAGNVYLTQAAGGSITVVSTNGAITLPTPATLTDTTSGSFTVTNTGNAGLNVTGYTSTNAVDFTAADATSGGCEAGAPLAPGGTCLVNVTFNPGPGEQGPLSGQIAVVSDAINSPVTVNADAVGLPLANSATASAVAAGAEVVNTPITATVTPKSGTTPTPTGTVTVTYTSWTVSTPNPCGGSGQPACAPTVYPAQVTTPPAELGADGTASFALAPVLAGAQTVTVSYSGDRVYGRSTGTMNISVAKSAIVGLIHDQNEPPFLPFVLESGSVSGSIPYDGSVSYWQYTMPLAVATAAGIPTGTITFMDDSSTCPPGTSPTGQGAAVCALANYKGIACPESAGSGVVNVQPIQGLPAGGKVTFATGCLQMPQFTTYTPVVSTHYVTPVYSGDANFLGFTDPEPKLFQALRSPLVAITSNPESLSVPKGSTGSATLTLTSLLGYGFGGKNGQLNDYNFPVTLTCDNLPPHSVCTFAYPSTIDPNQPSAPNSVQIPCTGTTAAADNCLPGTVTVTINTNVSAGTSTSQNTATAASITLASIFGFGMFGLFFRRRMLGKSRVLLMVLMMLVGGGLAVSLTACNTTDLTPNAVLTTQPGTYAVAITAQQVGYQCIPTSNKSAANCTTPSGGTGISVYGSQNQVSLPFYLNVTVQ